MKKLFFKTTRSTGESVWMRGRLQQKYEVGKRYQFPKELPAHAWTYDGLLSNYELLRRRCEPNGGQRVILCYGEVESREVIVDDDWTNPWDMDGLLWHRHNLIQVDTSYDFEVIGALVKREADSQEEISQATAKISMSNKLASQFKVSNTDGRKLFFKTVRSNYTSVYARGPLRMRYEVGKRYQFPSELPAHVFLTDDMRGGNEKLDFDNIFVSRAESAAGNRVLLCYGKTEHKRVPVFPVGAEGPWRLKQFLKEGGTFRKEYYDLYTEYRHTSSDFVVLGELALPTRFGGERPRESLPTGDKPAELPDNLRGYFKTSAAIELVSPTEIRHAKRGSNGRFIKA